MAWGLLEQHHLPGAATFDPQYGEKNAQAALEAFLGSALGADDPNVSTVVVNDLPARALIDQAEAAELLVVGARGLGGLQGLLLGSVSQRCLTHAGCPTVVVR
jgi:nucleotide-binding universal stress UspA family protein